MTDEQIMAATKHLHSLYNCGWRDPDVIAGHRAWDAARKRRTARRLAEQRWAS